MCLKTHRLEADAAIAGIYFFFCGSVTFVV
jgi:hypothetical protein